jgi:2,4-dienoyl-CoA reductase-like NADH-dependent reductase (Old Yellow Enzyme family)
MGSMHTGLEDRDHHTDRLAEYFAERAGGGVGEVSSAQARRHRRITRADHDSGAKILLILCFGTLRLPLTHVIGAALATELDAKRAIKRGTELAAKL